LNNIRNSAVVKAGQKLLLQDGGTGKTAVAAIDYKIQRGDTLYSLARIAGISVETLRGMNNMGSGAALKAGQTIKLPGTENGSGTTSPQPTAAIPAAAIPALISRVQWPVPASSVTPVKGKISGVQLTSPDNANVSSMRGGTVVFSGDYRGFGNTVFVQAPDGLVYAYTGLGSIYVANGSRVAYGDTLGTTEGRLTFMVYRNGAPMDPAAAPRG
jgi:murein DD-endopeptidase MepM/ murein hydrolase activator NlpD